MTLRTLFHCAVFLGITACAQGFEEPVIVEESVVLEEPAIEASPILRCGDEDDGIGGTGCSPD